MLRISLPHEQGQRHHIRLLLVDFVKHTRIIVKLNAFNSVARDQHVHFRHWAENSNFCKPHKGPINVALPFIMCAELLILHDLELVSG